MKTVSHLTCFVLATLLLFPYVGCNGGDRGEGDATTTSGVGEATVRSAEVPEFVSLGTAKIGGTFYQVGAGIASALSNGKDIGGWRKVTAESTAGSLENFRRLDSGDIQIGMANSSITYFAVRGEAGFDKKYDVKSIMTMFPLVAMFVTKKGSGVESIADLKGKRVVLGPEGAGFKYFVRPIIEEHGVKLDDFEIVYAAMQNSVGYLQDESVAATFLGGGFPSSPAITSASSTMDIQLVPYGAEERKRLAADYPSFDEITIPAGTYKGQDAPYEGLNVGSAHLLVRGDANDDFVYNVTKIIYESREKVAERHRAAKAINEKNVVRMTGVDFHPGAIRYYKEIGIWPVEETAAAGVEGESAAESTDE